MWTGLWASSGTAAGPPLPREGGEGSPDRPRGGPARAGPGTRSERPDTHLQSGHFHGPVVLSHQEELHRDGLVRAPGRARAVGEQGEGAGQGAGRGEGVLPLTHHLQHREAEL